MLAETKPERREEYAGSIDSAVHIAIGQHREWQEKAQPSAKKSKRVLVRDGDSWAVRTPYLQRGHWRVRWQGMCRIVNPHWSNGQMAFEADWSRHSSERVGY